LDLYDEKPVKVKDEALFFAVVKAAFGMRRKTLLNALAGGMSLGKDLVREALENADIDAKRRGETLSLLEFANLADAFWAIKNS
jgi:16S rRNA (adenine1518-N6/adenine1519-N6)-dimethyltransferase